MTGDEDAQAKIAQRQDNTYTFYTRDGQLAENGDEKAQELVEKMNARKRKQLEALKVQVAAGELHAIARDEKLKTKGRQRIAAWRLVNELWQSVALCQRQI